MVKIGNKKRHAGALKVMIKKQVLELLLEELT
jgi:hypothetical protein